MRPEEDSLVIEREEGERAALECNDTLGESQISKKKFHFIQKLHTPYLTKQKIQETLQVLRRGMFNFSMLVKSSHGTAKTTGLFKVLINQMQKMYNRELRVLYICNRISNVKKAARDLELDCYLDENGKANIQLIRTSKRLAICEHSLHHLFDGNNIATQYDLVGYDESENAHFDAYTLSNQNQDNIRKIMGSATMQVFMDSDMGGHTYNLCHAINKENQKRMVLIENTYSHLMESNHYFHNKEANVYPRIVSLLEEGKLVACCVGHRDREKKQWLTAMDNIINAEFGREIAFHIDQNNKNKHKGLFVNPDEYIAELIDKGYQHFTHSPVLLTGWRCSIPFDNSINIHRSHILTAPQMLQGARRFEGIKTFDWYIGANRKTTELQKLEEAHQVSYAMGRSLGFGKKQYERSFQQERTLTAEKRLQMFKGNIALHLSYMISDYQGFMHNAPEYSKELQAKYLELCEGEADELKRIRAQGIHEDETKKGALLGNFYGVAGTEDWEDTQDYLERNEHVQDNADEIIELLSLIFSTKEERAQWNNTKPYWIRQHDFTYPLIGNIIERTLEQAFNGTPYTIDTLKKMIQRRDGIVLLEKDRFATKEHTALMEKWKRTLDSKKSRWFRAGMIFPTFIKAMTEFVDLDVTWKTKAVVSVVELKRDLIKEYGELGRIDIKLAERATKESGAKDVGKATALVHAILARRYIEDKELSDNEYDYIYNTGKFLTIKPKKGTHRLILSHLGLIDDNFERYEEATENRMQRYKKDMDDNFHRMVAKNKANKDHINS